MDQNKTGNRYQSVDLDCAPGMVRPDDLIRGVLGGLDIEPIEWEVQPFFGNSCYTFDIPRDVWEREYQPTIRQRITALYNTGVIRYGSW